MKTLKVITTIILSAALIMPVTVFAMTGEAQVDGGYLVDDANHNSQNVQSTAGHNVNTNDGTIVNNVGGTVNTNNRIVEINRGTIVNNSPSASGTIKDYLTQYQNPNAPRYNEQTQPYNRDTGVVHVNNGLIQANGGTVGTNNGTINEISGATDTVSNPQTNYLGQVGQNLYHWNTIQTTSTGSGTVTTNNGVVNTNNGTVETNAASGTVVANNGTVMNNSGVVETNNATVAQNDSIVGENNNLVTTNNNRVENNKNTVETNNDTVNKNSSTGVVRLNTANAVVKTNDGDIQENHGTVETNSGTVVNSDDGVVEVNFGGSVTAGTVKINLGDDGDTSNTNVLQQMWGVLSGVWDNIDYTANTGDTYDGHTDNDVKIWLWDEGAMVLQSKTSDILTNVSIKAGSAGTATITKLSGNKWQITGITGNIELDTEFTDPTIIPASQPTSPNTTPPNPHPASVKPEGVETKETDKIKTVSPVAIQFTVPEPIVETPAPAPVQFVSAIQVAIGVDDTTTVPANAVTASSEQIAQLEAIAQAAVGPAYVVLSAFTINNTTIDPASTDNTTLIASLSGLTAGSRIYLMFTDATGKTRYLPYTVTNDNQIVKKIKGISDGAMVTILVKNN